MAEMNGKQDVSHQILSWKDNGKGTHSFARTRTACHHLLVHNNNQISESHVVARQQPHSQPLFIPGIRTKAIGRSSMYMGAGLHGKQTFEHNMVVNIGPAMAGVASALPWP